MTTKKIIDSQIKKEYLLDEVRDGFYVPAEIKQAWAIELDVLGVVESICKKYGIKYFAEWGTLLGAVRHEGFIPWDDDLDIAMLRGDYERFLEVADEELPEGYCVFNYKNHDDFWHFMARIVNRNRISYEKEELRKSHNFPYITGIDIFVLDNISNDQEKEKWRNTVARYVIGVADEIAEKEITELQVEEYLKRIESLCHTMIDRKLKGIPLRRRLYQEAEKLFMMFSQEDSEYVIQMMPDGLYTGDYYRLKTEYYKNWAYSPFEQTMIPVPGGYDEVLRIQYQNYMQINQKTAGHDYPFFLAQKRKMEQLSGVSLTQYDFSSDLLYCNKKKQGGIKAVAQECLDFLQQKNMSIQQDFISKKWEATCILLQDSQQLAIELGTMIEIVKGEKCKAIPSIEIYCESLYQIYAKISNIENTEHINQDIDTGEINHLMDVFVKMQQEVTTYVIERREIVFLPFAIRYWEMLVPLWEFEKKEENCDVFVIPIPYYYKDYDGSLIERQYDGDKYPEDVCVLNYEKYDFSIHYPDKIYIQNPYDQTHNVISVAPDFYCANLRQYAGEIVYVPYFMPDEFTLENERAYDNMKYYCTVPGVVQADKVLLSSEQAKQLYIHKLVEYAGELTRRVWEEKIEVTNQLSKKENEKEKTINDWMEQVPLEWNRKIWKKDGSKKKVILYCVQISFLFQYKEIALEKIQSTMKSMKEHQDEVVMIFRVHLLENAVWTQENQDVFQRFHQIIEQFQGEEWGIYIEGKYDELSCKIADAYYGDNSRYMKYFEEHNKPVMPLSLVQYPLVFENICVIDEVIWATSFHAKGLYKYRIGATRAECVTDFPDEKERTRMFGDITQYGDKLILTPFSADAIVIYDMKQNDMVSIPLQVLNNEMKYTIPYISEKKFAFCKIYDKYAFLFPCTYPVIVKINLETYEVEYLSDGICKLARYAKFEHAIYFYKGLCVNEKVQMWCMAVGAIVEFDMKEESLSLLYLLEEERKYILMVYDGETYWLLPSAQETEILKLSKTFQKTEKINLPQNIKGEGNDFLYTAIYGDDILFFPGTANHTISINKKNNKIHVVHDLDIHNIEIYQANPKLSKYLCATINNNVVVAYENEARQMVLYDLKTRVVKKESICYSGRDEDGQLLVLLDILRQK